MKIRIYQVDAFADSIFRGNPAAVCPLDEWLPDSTLQSIAEENNLSETAYYVETDGVFHIRWFTPNKEVNLCGHATLATAFVIFHLGHTGDTLSFTSLSGPLEVSRSSDQLTLDFPKQVGTPMGVPAELTTALGKEPKTCYKTEDILAVFENQDDIESLDPDFRLLKELDCRGILVTAPGKEVDFVSRFFAPKYGIDEDPVTGSAHCTLTPYWAAKLGRAKLSARQLSKRIGNLWCELKGDRVLISGRAVLYLEGTITI